VRFVFFALLFVNLAYLAWSHWIDAPRPARVNETMTHLPQLKLVDELPPAQRPQPRAAQKTSLDTATSCVSLGPFADVGSTSQAAALLKDRGFEPRQRTEPGAVTESYWVYVGGLSQPEADRALVALEHNGIRDALVMPDNGEVRRLSLGVYAERARADRRAEAVRQAGLKADIGTRKMPGTLYWLDLAPVGGTDAVPVQELTARGVASRIAMQPCPAAPPIQHGAAARELSTASTPRL